MEQTYMIVGIQNNGEYKKLELVPLESTIKKKMEINPLEALHDFTGLINRTKQEYMKQKQVDVIRIPDQVFKDMNLMIDGSFTIQY